MIPDRNSALALFREHNSSDSLYRHALAVEAVMRHAAHNRGEDPEKWGLIGLVHDLDWEKWPEQHCAKTKELLETAGWPEDWVRAVLSHGYGIMTDVEPRHVMEKFLFAADELTGLVTATALVRPSRSVMDMTPKSVKKKWKDRSFSAGVDRGIIEKGAAMLDMELTDLITEVIAGMRNVAGELGLAGG